MKEGVENIKDLAENMMLEGTITNVTNFGAFVDIGVHQDGLVHISCLADKFVDDPHKIVKAGQIVKVKVLEVDTQRKRIALTMKLHETSKNLKQKRANPTKPNLNQPPMQHKKPQQSKSAANNVMAEKLAAAFKK